MECTSEAVELDLMDNHRMVVVELVFLDRIHSGHSFETRESVGHTWDKDMKAFEKAS